LSCFVVSFAAHVAVFIILATTAGIAHASRLVRQILRVRHRHRSVGNLHLLLTGTFYNENWFRSHILPLSSASALAKIHVVTDEPLFRVEKVAYVCPPRRAICLFGRTISRSVALLWTAARWRPDVLMGYHIMPNAILCLVAASLFGGRSVYQMTGGPIQIIGGGTGSENALLCLLRRHSVLLEKMLFHVVRLFDVVVVRGRRAAAFVKEQHLARRIAVVSGSVDTERFCPNGSPKQYDLVLVARHIKEKQPHLFVELVHEIRKKQPSIRATMVGDGPLTEELKQLARTLGVEENIHFLGKLDRVEEVLASSRLFVLTSKTEGLAIAMMEAMAAGLPVLAPDVGELGELLVDGHSGLFIRPRDVAATAEQVVALLDDKERIARMSNAGRKQAVQRGSVEAVARRWDSGLESILNSGD